MFCSRCGQDNPENSQICANCGQGLSAESLQAQVTQAGTPAGGPLPEAKNDGKAVASLILGICSVTILGCLAGIPAIVLGHISRSKIRNSMGQLKGEGMALAGLIMGYLSCALIPVVLIIAAIAIPNLLRARSMANETSAIAFVRTINTAAITYQVTYPKVGFPAEMKQFGPSHGQPPSENAADFIDESLASGLKNGYRITYSSKDTDGDGVADVYTIVAEPVQPGSTGFRSFCSDETGEIRSAPKGQICTKESAPL